MNIQTSIFPEHSIPQPKHRNEVFELLKYVRIRKHAFEHDMIRRTGQVAAALKTLEVNLKLMRSKSPMARARTIVIHQDNLVAIAPCQWGRQKEIHFRIIEIIEDAEALVHS